MSTKSSAAKRHKQNLKQKVRNRRIRSTVKTATKEVRTAISGGDPSKAAESLKEASSVIARAGSKGVLHKKTVARKVSRMAKAVHKASAAK